MRTPESTGRVQGACACKYWTSHMLLVLSSWSDCLVRVLNLAKQNHNTSLSRPEAKMTLPDLPVGLAKQTPVAKTKINGLPPAKLPAKQNIQRRQLEPSLRPKHHSTNSAQPHRRPTRCPSTISTQPPTHSVFVVACPAQHKWDSRVRRQMLAYMWARNHEILRRFVWLFSSFVDSSLMV